MIGQYGEPNEVPTSYVELTDKEIDARIAKYHDVACGYQIRLAKAEALGDALAAAVEAALAWPTEQLVAWETLERDLKDAARAWRAAREGR